LAFFDPRKSAFTSGKILAFPITAIPRDYGDPGDFLS